MVRSKTLRIWNVIADGIRHREPICRGYALLYGTDRITDKISTRHVLFEIGDVKVGIEHEHRSSDRVHNTFDRSARNESLSARLPGVPKTVVGLHSKYLALNPSMIRSISCDSALR